MKEKIENIIVIGAGAGTTAQQLANIALNSKGAILIMQEEEQINGQFGQVPIPYKNYSFEELPTIKDIGPFLTGKQKRSERRKKERKNNKKSIT